MECLFADNSPTTVCELWGLTWSQEFVQFCYNDIQTAYHWHEYHKQAYNSLRRLHGSLMYSFNSLMHSYNNCKQGYDWTYIIARTRQTNHRMTDFTWARKCDHSRRYLKDNTRTCCDCHTLAMSKSELISPAGIRDVTEDYACNSGGETEPGGSVLSPGHKSAPTL